MRQLAGRLLAPTDRGPSVVTVADGVVGAIDPGAAASAGALGGPGYTIVPGLIDIQVNGAFGHDFSDPAAPMAEVSRELTRFGVAGFLPTMVTSPRAAYERCLPNLREQSIAGSSRILGAHLEGPFISPLFPGTHDASSVRPPDLAEAADWLEWGDVRVITLAPELPGALPLIRWLRDRGVRVAAGHTAATWADGEAAMAAGVTLATHLFNAMEPVHHRRPSLAALALSDSITVSVIGDGVHLSPETVRMVADIKGPGGVILVTDALAGLGMPPGRYRLSGAEFVSDGVTGRLPDGTLSGSVLPLHRAVHNLIEWGVNPATAVAMASHNPASWLGLADRYGRIDVGRTADLVLLDQDWEVVATLIAGEVAFLRDDHAGWAALREAS